MKTLSVILTTYNGAKTIERTITSIRNQQGINEKFKLELIVVDDCSADHTVSLLEQQGIPVLSTGKNSGGPNKGRNIGLKKASGDYICIADQDDSWEPHRIITLLPYLEQVPIVTSGYTIIDNAENRKTTRVKQHKAGYIYFGKNATFLGKLSRTSSGQNTYPGAIVFRKALKTVLFEERYGMVDYDWILRLFHQQDAIEVCNTLYTRFVDGGNLSLNETYRQKDFDYSLMFIKNYSDQYPKEVKTATRKIYGTMARYYY
ncbi:MAG: glycosyltransferase, partial [Sinomicrobium sp.]|nr:glycosyltransferase [Sinomicrobium sp.]